MRNTRMILMVAAICAGFWSCSKSNDAKPASKYTFTVNGNTYTETSAVDSASTGGSLFTNASIRAVSVAGTSADGKAQGAIELLFAGSGKPAAGTYTVTAANGTIGPSEVAIFSFDKISVSKGGIYSARGTDATSVKVTVNSGKLAISMPSIITSGSNIDNTDPKNSVLTPVEGSVSGSFSE